MQRKVVVKIHNQEHFQTSAQKALLHLEEGGAGFCERGHEQGQLRQTDWGEPCGEGWAESRLREWQEEAQTEGHTGKTHAVQQSWSWGAGEQSQETETCVQQGRQGAGLEQ